MGNYTFQQLEEQMNRRDTVHYAFIRQVLLMASGLFGILVSLHTDSSSSGTWAGHAFAIAIGSLALGILLLSIALYAQVAVHKQVFLQLRDAIAEQLRDGYTSRSVSGEPHWLFATSEVAAYLSFLVALVALVCYTVMTA